MTKHDAVQGVGLMFALCLLPPGPLNARRFDIVTLVSSNEEQSGSFGRSVSGAGDVNQDGFVDVIVGAPFEDPGTSPANAGRAYVLSGQDGSLLFELISPNEDVQGVFGFSVSGAGDANQDGFPDVIVGAWLENPGASHLEAGRAYLFSGQDGSLLFELISPNEEFQGFFGFSVSGIGDVNQDGSPDVIVGAHGEDPGTSPTAAGRAYIFSGQDGSLLSELVSPNEEQLGQFGASVAGTGDVNQDGFPDVIVGADQEDSGTGPEDAGRAYMFSGQDGSLLSELVSPNEVGSGGFGASVSGAGDVNQDGFADAIVGAFAESAGTTLAGRAYIFSGQDGSLLIELISPHEQIGGLFGGSVSGAGDFNQDGIADVIVGAYREEPGASPQDAGRVYAFSGQDGSLLFELRSPNQDEFGWFGASVAAADVNQDGFADVIVGAYQEDPDTSPDSAGRAYIFEPRRRR